MKNKSFSSQPEFLKALNLLSTFKLSQYRKSGSIFPSSELVAAYSNCSRLGNALCLCLPVQQAQAVQEHCPKS